MKKLEALESPDECRQRRERTIAQLHAEAGQRSFLARNRGAPLA
jgi:hypothetical protein